MASMQKCLFPNSSSLKLFCLVMNIIDLRHKGIYMLLRTKVLTVHLKIARYQHALSGVVKPATY